MTRRHDSPKFLVRYRLGLRTSIRNNGSAFGYSIVVTSSFAALDHLIGKPTLREIYLFIVGAVVAFAVIEAGATKFFSEKVRGERSDVVALGSAFSIASISAAVGATAGIAWLTSAWYAWPLAAFASSVTYLLVVAIEMALARGVEDAAEREKHRQ